MSTTITTTGITAMATATATDRGTAMGLLRSCLDEVRQHRGEDTVCAEPGRAWCVVWLDGGTRGVAVAAPRRPRTAACMAATAAEPEDEAARAAGTH